MPTRVQNEATGGLISYFYTDALTNKPITVAKTETQVTNAQACIMLKELPYRFTRVRLTDATMIEVDNADEVLTNKHYYVNYNNGMVYFHPSVGSKVFTFNYDSIGYVYTTSTRIATQWDGTTVIETLQDMMDTMNHAILVSTTYATADDLIRDIEARTLVCKNSIDSKVASANTSVDAKIVEANNKIGDVNTVITNANTTKASLQATIDSGNLAIYQTKTDNTLATTNKTMVGAINELATNPTNEWIVGMDITTQVRWAGSHDENGVPIAGITASGTENIIKKSKDGLVYLHINFETLDKEGYVKQGRFGNVNGLDICTIPTRFVPQYQIKSYAKIVYYNSTTLKYAKQLCEVWIYPNFDKKSASIILNYTTGTETTDPQAIDLIPTNDIYLYYGSIDLCYYANV